MNDSDTPSVVAEAEQRRIARVVLAIGAASSGAGMLEMMRGLVARRPSELLGLVVEDSAAVEHARSSLAREILPFGGERRLDASAVTRQIRARVRHVERDLAAWAAMLNLPHEVRVVRGALLDALAAEAERAEAMAVDIEFLVGDPALAAIVGKLISLRVSMLGLYRRSVGKSAGALAIVSADERSPAAIVAAARDVSATGSGQVSLLVVGAEAGVQSTRIESLTATLRESGVQPDRLFAIGATNARQIAGVAQRLGTRLLVMRQPVAAEDGGRVVELLEAPGYSLVLLS